MTRDPGQGPEAALPAELQALLRGRPLVLARPVWGHRGGRHLAARPGAGLLFRAHRPYAAGDDLRRLDWRAVARRDRPVVRLSEAEDELSLVLLLDGSGGMSYGTGPQEKARYAAALVAALAHLAIRQGDRLGFAAVGDGRLLAPLQRPTGGEARLHALLRALAELPRRGAAPWQRLLEDALPRLPRRSLVVLASDLLDPGAGEPDPTAAERRLHDGLALLRAHGHDVVLLQVLHRDELTFPWSGPEPLRFVDLRGARDDALASAAALRAGYLARLAAHLGELEATCERAGVHLHRVVTDEPLADALLSLLARLAGAPVARADAP